MFKMEETKAQGLENAIITVKGSLLFLDI